MMDLKKKPITLIQRYCLYIWLAIYCGFIWNHNIALATEFKFRVSSQLSDLDWNKGEVPQDLIFQLMEGLTKIDSQNKVVPAVAKSWKQSGTKIIFTLNEKAKWSDGKQVCAEDFVNAWSKATNPKTQSMYAHVLAPLKEAKAKSCQILEVTLKKPISFFTEITSHWISFPIRVDNDVKKPFTNGPYVISEWNIGKDLTAVKNQKYHSTNDGPEKIKAILITDDITALRLFEDGKIDWMRDLPFYERESLKKKKEYKAFGTNISYHLGFHVKSLDPDLRTVIFSAIDTKKIPQILKGEEVPFENAKTSTELIKKPKEIELNYYSKEIHNPLMEWLAADLEKKLGIQFLLKKEDSKIYWEKLKNQPYDLFLSGITPFTVHPYGYYSEFLSDTVANWGRFQNKKYDEIVEEMAVTKENTKKLAGLIQEAEKILLYSTHTAIVPLYKRKTLNLVSEKWNGFEMNLLGRVDFTKLRQKKGD